MNQKASCISLFTPIMIIHPVMNQKASCISLFTPCNYVYSHAICLVSRIKFRVGVAMVMKWFVHCDWWLNALQLGYGTSWQDMEKSVDWKKCVSLVTVQFNIILDTSFIKLSLPFLHIGTFHFILCRRSQSEHPRLLTATLSAITSTISPFACALHWLSSATHWLSYAVFLLSTMPLR